ncbi:hypothetical protein [Methylobacterium sp. GC_Met_1]|uniref:hypothetical protein n=1 Tax=Methylobacterium sp. GC_Met_1 TaxID=2937377 RepID=UPI002269D52E|nr:hypothetical protein [Methylobacterium sp. GC_Met_1]
MRNTDWDGAIAQSDHRPAPGHPASGPFGNRLYKGQKAVAFLKITDASEGMQQRGAIPVEISRPISVSASP